MPAPNILLILTDTQGSNMVGCYGRPDLGTPQIDALAQTGLRFERAYTTCPLCTPARAGLVTGIYAHTAGPWTNNLPLGSNVRTMGQYFQTAGYQTAYIGKWHLDGHDYFGTGICPPGWDPEYWYDGANYLAELSDAEIAAWRGIKTPVDLRKHSITAEFTWAHRITDRAIRFLEQRDAQPYLLVLSFDEPHHPFACPPEYAERFLDYDYPIGPGGLDTLQGKPAHQREWAAAHGWPGGSLTTRLPLYLGCNSFVDAEIGRVIAAARRTSPENTSIVYTSDHGDMLGAHRLAGKGPVMYDEITRIPLILQLPGQSLAGQTLQAPVSHIDLLPTLLDLAQIPAPAILEGESLLPLMRGEGQSDRSAVVGFQRYEIEHDSWGGFQPVRCLVSQRYKLVINLLHTDELYDLRDDPAELNNLIDDETSAAARDELHDRLLDWMNAKRDPFRGPVWERRPWRDVHRLAWRGQFRPRPADGIAPPVRDYDTGQPSRGVKIEFG
jgi:uncharacterized sulfatase